MEEHCHFAASQIADLLGVRGQRKRWHALCDAWRMSLWKSSAPAKIQTNNSKEEHLRQLKISCSWERLLRDATTTTCVEDHLAYCARAWDLLFENPMILQISREIAHALPFPQKDTFIAAMCFSMRDVKQVEEEAKQNPEKKNEITPFVRELESWRASGIFASVFMELTERFFLSCKLYLQLERMSKQAYGRYAENTFCEKYNKLHVQKIESRGLRVSRQMTFQQTPQEIMWSIKGILDGMVDGKVIEIKHRVCQLDPVPQPGDVIQTQMYLFLTDQKQGTLFQCVQERQNDFFCESTTIENNPQVTHEILQDLQKCVLFLHKAHNDNIFRHMLFLLNDEQRDCVLTEFFRKE